MHCANMFMLYVNNQTAPGMNDLQREEVLPSVRGKKFFELNRARSSPYDVSDILYIQHASRWMSRNFDGNSEIETVPDGTTQHHKQTNFRRCRGNQLRDRNDCRADHKKRNEKTPPLKFPQHCRQFESNRARSSPYDVSDIYSTHRVGCLEFSTEIPKSKRFPTARRNTTNRPTFAGVVAINCVIEMTAGLTIKNETKKRRRSNSRSTAADLN